MAFLGLLDFTAFTLCVLVLVVEIHQTQASSRGFFGRKTLTGEPSFDIGLCASAITIHGYKCQEVEVTTKDGYILGLQRIPESRSEVSRNVIKKEPVILQHGLMVDGTTWLLNGPNQDLPLILADNGFDVWIANSRGTRFSRKHTTLDPNSKKYWDWSWDDMVTYDFPAIFDHVSNQTGQKINYVGHSMGTLVALVSLSEGKLVNQLKSVALLSPIAYLSHMTTELGVVIAKSFFGELVALIGIAEFNPAKLPIIDFIKSVCAHPGVDCNDVFTALTGENCCLSTSAFNQFTKTGPQPSSTKNMLHLAQTVRSGMLTKFDYERLDLNLYHYGQLLPPIYNLSNIPHNVPIFMSYGGKDALSDVEDVKHLLDHFKFHDQDKLSVQFIENYAHADFIMAVNAKDLVYKNVTEFFKRKF